MEISKHAGIYGFCNRCNGKWYVGKTNNLYERYRRHKRDCKIDLNKQFYQAIQKYGWNNFDFYILKEYSEPPPKEELSRMEEYYIAEKNAYRNGYNASEKSSGGFYSNEHKEKCTKILNELNLKQKNENHPRTSFTKEEILQIFEYAMQGAPAKQIYELFKNHEIGYESFKQIYRGEHFKDYLPLDWEKRPIVSTNATLWGSWVQDIKTRVAKGEPLEEIYELYKDRCSRYQFNRIVNNKTYRNIHPCID